MKHEILEIRILYSPIPHLLIKRHFQKEVGSNYWWKRRRSERREIENYIVLGTRVGKKWP